MWSAATDDYTASPALSRFRFLATKMKEHECSASLTTTNPEAASAQLARYLSDAAEPGSGSGCSFWSSRRVTYSMILPLAGCPSIAGIRGTRIFALRPSHCWAPQPYESISGDAFLSETECTDLLTFANCDCHGQCCVYHVLIEKQVHHCAMCQAIC